MSISQRPRITMKGDVVAVRVVGANVEVWVASPTGDSSDSHIFTIPCRNEDQASIVSASWRKAWGL